VDEAPCNTMVTLLRAEAIEETPVVCDSDLVVVSANGLRDRFDIPLSAEKKIKFIYL